MLEFPGGRGIGGIRCLGEYVGNVCRKYRRCVGKCREAVEKAKMGAKMM